MQNSYSTYTCTTVQLMKVNAEVWSKITKGLFLIAIVYAERNISKDAEGPTYHLKNFQCSIQQFLKEIC